MEQDLHVVPMAVVSSRVAVVRLVYFLRTAQVIRVLRLRPAAPLLRVGVVRLACLFHARTAKRLTRALLLHPALRVPVCREGLAELVHHQLLLPDSCREPVQGCLLRARRHESVAERSWDFQS
jgi:hypothetical protein